MAICLQPISLRERYDEPEILRSSVSSVSQVLKRHSQAQVYSSDGIAAITSD